MAPCQLARAHVLHGFPLYIYARWKLKGLVLCSRQRRLVERNAHAHSGIHDLELRTNAQQALKHVLRRWVLRQGKKASDMPHRTPRPRAPTSSGNDSSIACKSSSGFCVLHPGRCRTVWLPQHTHKTSAPSIHSDPAGRRERAQRIHAATVETNLKPRLSTFAQPVGKKRSATRAAPAAAAHVPQRAAVLHPDSLPVLHTIASALRKILLLHIQHCIK